MQASPYQEQQQPCNNNNSFNNDNDENDLSLPSQIDNYHIMHTIGSGTFAKVKLCKHIPTNTTYAMKIFIKSEIPEMDYAFIERELQFLKEFTHDNIIKLIDTIDKDDKYFIITEYCENGELFNMIVDNVRLSCDTAASFYYQLINGLEYIHNNNTVHRDIKPENLLIKHNKYLKIIDFGLSNYLPEDGLLETPCGSPSYASPEMISGNVVNEKSCDLWALGVIMYQMFYGVTPFKGETLSNTKENILRGKTRFNEDVGEIVNDLIMKLLNSNYAERIGFQAIEQIKEHAFFDGVDFTNLNFQTMCCCVNAAKNKHCEHTTTCSYGSNSSCGDYCNIRETCYSDNCMDSSEEDEDKEKEKEEIAVHVVVMKGNDCEIVKMVKNVNVNNNYINLC
jgi:serine/threonine protein kinase